MKAICGDCGRVNYPHEDYMPGAHCAYCGGILEEAGE